MCSAESLQNGVLVGSFCALGFKTRRAFVNVCLGLDRSIAVWELIFFWEYGICLPGFEEKIENIIELLKTE